MTELYSPLPQHELSSTGNQVYSLLFLDDQHNNNQNMSAKSALGIYLGCASLTASSALKAGVDFTVLTNDAQKLLDAVREAALPPFKVREIVFTLNIPRGIRYYQAHYKISVMKSFSTGAFGPHPTLIDSDIFIRRDFTKKCALHELVAYDVSHKASHLAHDMSIMIEPAPGQRQWWAGGEFISGTPQAFAALSQAIEELLPRYVANVGSFIHVSDETPVSAALNQLANSGFKIADAGRELNIIGRWHSSRTIIPQEKLSELWTRDIVHLPADKAFLALLALSSPTPEAFMQAYEKYATRKLFTRSLLHPLLNVVKGRKHVPVLK